MISLYMSYTLRRCWRTALIHSTTVNKLSAPWMAAFWDGCSFGWLLLGMAAPWMAAPWMAVSWDGYFLDGCFLVFLLTLNKSKKLTAKLLWKKLDAYVFFF